MMTSFARSYQGWFFGVAFVATVMLFVWCAVPHLSQQNATARSTSWVISTPVVEQDAAQSLVPVCVPPQPVARSMQTDALVSTPAARIPSVQAARADKGLIPMPPAIQASAFVPVPELFPPRLLQAVDPKYPEAVRRQGASGTVGLRLKINTQGSVAAVEVASSSGVLPLDEAAAQAAWQWQFVPARQVPAPRGESEAVVAWYEVPVRFQLDEHSPL